jgi:branched-chain amino acid transport system substrate-binding protein
LPIIATTGPVMYCYSPSLHPPDDSYGFAGGPSIADYVLATVRYFRGRGWRRIGLITSADATGQDGDRAVDAALAAPENRSVTLVDREHFNDADMSVAAQMTRIKASGAQAVIFWTSGTPFGTLLHGASDVGLQIPIAASVSNLNYSQLASYGSFMPEALYMVGPPFAAADQLPDGPVKRSVMNYLNLIQQAHLKPAQGQVTAWDPTMLVLEALKKLGPAATAQQIHDYLMHVRSWAGVNGTYDFGKTKQRGVASDWLFMLRWNGAAKSITVVSKPGAMPL